MLVKFLLYRLNPVFQVLNCLMLKDIFDNILAGQPFEPVVLIPFLQHPINQHN
ncbi:MAG: hypothetical protein ABSG99_09090 [Sedimentisphaerales bacterium]|jgi:hypothetical protein